MPYLPTIYVLMSAVARFIKTKFCLYLQMYVVTYRIRCLGNLIFIHLQVPTQMMKGREFSVRPRMWPAAGFRFVDRDRAE
jgi:hypothetical protein